MTKGFVHPLARAARVWPAESHDGAEQRILVIVTTMELDPKHKGYQKKLVEKLSHAAKEYLAQSSDATEFLIMNPMSHWRISRSQK
jgi:hypothetical protein